MLNESVSEKKMQINDSNKYYSSPDNINARWAKLKHGLGPCSPWAILCPPCLKNTIITKHDEPPPPITRHTLTGAAAIPRDRMGARVEGARLPLTVDGAIGTSAQLAAVRRQVEAFAVSVRLNIQLAIQRGLCSHNKPHMRQYNTPPNISKWAFWTITLAFNSTFLNPNCAFACASSPGH